MIFLSYYVIKDVAERLGIIILSSQLSETLLGLLINTLDGERSTIPSQEDEMAFHLLKILTTEKIACRRCTGSRESKRTCREELGVC